MLTFLLWLVLAVLSLPLAIAALLLFPIIWLAALPLRLVGISVAAAFDVTGALIRLPARLLRGQPT